jgi:hypothetical protein
MSTPITTTDATVATASAYPLTRLLYPKKQACFLLSMSLRNLDYRITLGTVKFVKRGRSVPIPRSEVLRLAKGDHAGAMATMDSTAAAA